MRTKYTKLQGFIDNGKLLKEVYGPEVKLGFGLGLIFSSLVLAIKATKENADEIKAAEEKIIEVHQNKEDDKFYKSEAEYRRTNIQAYRDYVKVNAKAYGGALAALILGMWMVIDSHKDVREAQMKEAALAGALAKELNDVYSKMEEKLGKEEVDRIRTNIEQREVEIDGEKKVVNYVKQDWNGWYTYKWTKESHTYRANRLLREAMVDSIEAYGNQLLRIRAETSRKKFGWLWLNEMLTAFDIPIADEGQECGWIFEDHNRFGDNYVSVSMVDAYETNPATGKLEEITLLTFNVDGSIRGRIFPGS